MKQAILFTAFIASVQICSARSVPVENSHNFHHSVYNKTTLITLQNMRQMLSEVLNAIGVQADFELREANVLNIEAVISHRKRYISYNPEFINEVNSVTKDKWAIMTLLAHEVAHHLEGHTMRKGGSRPKLELEADEFAGFILHKLGASVEQAQEVMKYIAGTEASKTHPARASRMLAIYNGWNRAANAEVIVASKDSDSE